MFTLPELKTSEVLVYLRKSRTDDPSLSVAETVAKHERMLDDFSRRTWGDVVPEQNRFREVVSGETIDARPEVQKVLRLIEQPRYRAILIVEPQRLSRGDLEDIGRLSKILRYTGTLVITLQGSFDLSDERDRDFFERELKRGNEYLEYQKRIMGNGRLASVERGNYLGTVAPYGYRRVWLREGKKKAPSLEVEPGEAEIVQLIFRMYADGKGASAICRHLNISGAPTRAAALWRTSTIYTILDNPVYIGMVRWQSTREIRSIVNGELESRRLSQDDYPLFPGKHPAIVDEALWGAVRALRAAGSLPRVKLSREPVNPFAGLVRCARCGSAIVMLSSNPKASPRLRCVERHVCKTPSCRYQDFVAAVSAALRENLENIEVSVGGGPAPSDNADIQRLEKRVAALAQKESALWEKYAEGMPKPIFESLLEKTRTEQAEVAALLSDERSRLASRETVEAQIASLHEALALLPRLDDVPVAAANRLLKSCIRRIVYDRQSGERPAGRGYNGWNHEPIELAIELAF